MGIIFTGKSDIGKKRSSNQDSIYMGAEERLFLVADGMGGHQGGDIASQMAVDLVSKTFKQQLQAPVKEAIEHCCQLTNRSILEFAQKNEKLKGMGTTLIGVHFRDQYLHLFNVGDSRCYLVHHGELYQISRDHSLVQEKLNLGIYNRQQAAADRHKNILVRSVGFEPKLDVDIFNYKVHRGDIFLLCSDGLHGPVADSQIMAIINRHLSSGEMPNQKIIDFMVEDLINQANALGGPDNVSVVMAAAI